MRELATARWRSSYFAIVLESGCNELPAEVFEVGLLRELKGRQEKTLFSVCGKESP